MKRCHIKGKRQVRQRWLPDREVFTDINIPVEYFMSALKQQAVVNAGITFTFDDELTDTHESYHYPEGIMGYVRNLTPKKASLNQSF